MTLLSKNVVEHVNIRRLVNKSVVSSNEKVKRGQSLFHIKVQDKCSTKHVFIASAGSHSCYSANGILHARPSSTPHQTTPDTEIVANVTKSQDRWSDP